MNILELIPYIFGFIAFVYSMKREFGGVSFKLPRRATSIGGNAARCDADDGTDPITNIDGTLMVGGFDTNLNLYGFTTLGQG